MSLAYVQAAAATVIYLIATWAGLMISMALLLPKQASKAEATLEKSPGRTFGVGIGMALILGISLLILNIPNPLAKLVGFLLLFGLGGLLAVGASGIAYLLGKRIGALSGEQTSFGTLMRGSIAYSLAGGFPIIGWWLFTPLTLLFALGAGTLAVLPDREVALPPIGPGQKSDYDVLEQRRAI